MVDNNKKQQHQNNTVCVLHVDYSMFSLGVMWVPELFKFPLFVMQDADLFVSVDVIVLVWLVPAIYVIEHEIKASSSRHVSLS